MNEVVFGSVSRLETNEIPTTHRVEMIRPHVQAVIRRDKSDRVPQINILRSAAVLDLPSLSLFVRTLSDLREASARYLSAMKSARSESTYSRRQIQATDGVSNGYSDRRQLTPITSPEPSVQVIWR